MYFILVTLSLLTSLLLHSGLGELPEECSADSSGENDPEGKGVELRLNCTTSYIEVMYRYVYVHAVLDALSILYTCQHPNGTQIFQNEQVLVESTNHQSGIEPIPNSYWIGHGIVCNFYACYTSYEPPGGFMLSYSKTRPVTCTVIDIDICTEDCTARGARACQTDTSKSLPLGYGCICGDGYVWNATHCENVDECNTTNPDHRHNCSADEGYHCLDLEGSFMCVPCTEEEEWNGTSCIILSPTMDSNLSTMLTDSGSADAPTIYDGVSTEGATTSTNTPTTYSTFLSEGDISKVHAVPTAVGVLCFLLVLIGVLVGLFVVVLYLHSKRKNDRSVYNEMTYYPGYPCYPGYVDKIDMNFEPVNSIHPPSVDHLSFIFQSSVESHLNRLWEEPDTCVCTTQHHTLTSRPHHLHLSWSEKPSATDISSNNDHCGQNVDNCIDQSTDKAEQSMNSAYSSLRVAQEMRDHPLRKDLDDFNDDVLPENTITPQLQSCNCITMESVAGSIQQTDKCHFRQSSVSTLESERMHFDLTGSGLTDTSGYITCISKRVSDHLEELEQI